MHHFRRLAIIIALVALTACEFPVKTMDVITPTLAKTPLVIAPTAASVVTAVPTCKPLPADSFQSVGSLLAQEGNTLTDTLAVNMLRVFLEAGRGSDRLYVGGMWTDFFGIEIITDTVSVVWEPWSEQLGEITNSTVSLHAFEHFPLHTRSQASSADDYLQYLQSIKLLLADSDSKTVYWVKWKDLIPWRPTGLEGWIDDDIFVFSKFGNPWHGFLTAIDARQRKPLLTIQLEYWCR